MKKNNGWVNNLARVIKKKDGGYFLKFERQKNKDGKPYGDNPFPLAINEGDIFQMKRKEDDLQKLVDEGRMSQETADKICRTVRFEISKAPSRDGDAKKSNQSSDGDDEVNF